MNHAKKLKFKHISTSTVICRDNEKNLVNIIDFIRANTQININNFCNLEVSIGNSSDYNLKSKLFPNLSIIRNQIKMIHNKFD
jgi:hypothetical protein